MRSRVAVLGISVLARMYFVVLRVLSVAVPDPLEVVRMVGILDGTEEG